MQRSAFLKDTKKVKFISVMEYEASRLEQVTA